MSATIWVTEACQLHCDYCYEGEKKSSFMTEEMALRACSFALNHHEENFISGRFLLQLHGGEPLLNESAVFKICGYISEYFCGDRNKYAIRMTTNALNLNSSNLSFIAKHMEQISISIDGAEVIHNYHRKFRDGRGSFEFIYPKLRNLLVEMPNSVARMTVTPYTAANFYESVIFLFDTGFKWISAVMDESDENWNENIYNVMEQQIALCAEYVNKKRAEGSAVHMGLFEPDGFEKLKAPCSAGVKDLHIMSDGRLYACNNMIGVEEFCIGDIDKGIDFDRVKILTQYNEVSNSECEGCGRYDFCAGTRCKIINKIRTGDYNKACMGTCYQENAKVFAHKYMEVYSD